MTVQVETLSCRGGRSVNQDAVGSAFAIDGSFVGVLADGLGGHNGGQVAAKAAVDAIIHSVAGAQTVGFDDLDHLFIDAANAVHNRRAAEPDCDNMRTTLVLLLVRFDGVRWLHCGDSRLYKFDRQGYALLTRDHSVPQMLVACDELRQEGVRKHPDRNRLLRAIGSGGPDEKYTLSSITKVSDQETFYLLASDGFWELLLEEQMLDCRRETASAWLAQMAAVIEPQIEDDSDNYSAVMLRV